MATVGSHIPVPWILYELEKDLTKAIERELKKEKHRLQASEALRYRAYHGVALLPPKPRIRIERL